MSIYDWSPTAFRNQIAQRRLVDESILLLGQTGFALNEAEIAMIAELASRSRANTTYLNYQATSNPGFQIQSNFDVSNSLAFSYTNNGVIKNEAVTQTWDTGTAATIATAKWGVALLSETSAGTKTVTWFTNAGAGYASLALAVAAITDPGATQTLLGYVGVLAAGSTWTAGTDALAGGAGGTPATTTTYVNTSNPNSLRLPA